MPLSEFETYRLQRLVETFCDEQGPPAAIRDKLRWGFAIDAANQTVEMFEIRPHFQDPGRIIESRFAKAAYVKTSRHWKVSWMRGTLKWARYEPCPTVKTFEAFLALVKADEYHCFFG